MIRLNQIKEQGTELEAHVAADIGSLGVTSTDLKDGLEFTLIKLHEGIHRRLGSGAVGSSGLWDAQGGTDGVIASFSVNDAMSAAVVENVFNEGLVRIAQSQKNSSAANAADSLILTMDGRGSVGNQQGKIKLANTEGLGAFSNAYRSSSAEVSDAAVVIEAAKGALALQSDKLMSLESVSQNIAIGNLLVDTKEIKIGHESTDHLKLHIDSAGTSTQLAAHINSGAGAFTIDADGFTLVDLADSVISLHSTSGDYGLHVGGKIGMNSSSDFHATATGNVQLFKNLGSATDAQEMWIGSSTKAAAIVNTAGSSASSYSDSVFGVYMEASTEKASMEFKSDLGGLRSYSGKRMVLQSGENRIGSQVANWSSVQNADTTPIAYAADGFIAGLQDSEAFIDNTIWFDDINSDTTWAAGYGLPLSVAKDEWTLYRDTFGEVSLLGALYRASAGATDSFYNEIEILDASVASGTDIFGLTMSDNLVPANATNSPQVLAKDETGTLVTAPQVMDASSSDDEIAYRAEVYVNGQRMALNGDCSIQKDSGSGDIELTFTFALEVGDIVIVKV